MTVAVWSGRRSKGYNDEADLERLKAALTELLA
jgi:hypothetical protein